MKKAVLILVLLLLLAVTVPAAWAAVTTGAAEKPAATITTGTTGAGGAGETGSGANDDTKDKPKMPLMTAFMWAFVGVLLSFFIPIISKLAGKTKDLQREGKTIDSNAIWLIIAPYFWMVILSFLLSIIVVAFLLNGGTPILEDQWFMVFLAGYGIDSTLQKLKTS